MVATCGGVFFGVAIWVAVSAGIVWLALVPASSATRRSRRSSPGSRCRCSPSSTATRCRSCSSAPAPPRGSSSCTAANLRPAPRRHREPLPPQALSGECVGSPRSSRAGAALWLAPGALAAGWCGSGETPDRPRRRRRRASRSTRSCVVPSDGADTFAGRREPACRRRRLADGVVDRPGPDPRAALRPGGVRRRDVPRHLVRAARRAGGLASRARTRAFSRIANDLVSRRLPERLQEVPRLLRRAVVQPGICGTGGGGNDDFHSGPVLRPRLARRLPRRAGGCDRRARAAARARRAAGRRAARVPGRPGPPVRLRRSSTCSRRRPTGGRCSSRCSTVGHDDYYAHSGAWNDIQDSLWLQPPEHAAGPARGHAVTGAGAVSSDLPGVDCNADCTTQWDQGTTVALTAIPTVGTALRCTGPARAPASGTCTVTLAAAQSVTAVFGPRTIPVRVTTTGRGTRRAARRSARRRSSRARG